MKSITGLLAEISPRDRATPSDFRLGKAIKEQGGVDVLEASDFKVIAKVQPAGGQKRTVELTATGDGLKCRCT